MYKLAAPTPFTTQEGQWDLLAALLVVLVDQLKDPLVSIHIGIVVLLKHISVQDRALERRLSRSVKRSSK